MNSATTQTATVRHTQPTKSFYSLEREFIASLREYFREFHVDGDCDRSFLFWVTDHLEKINQLAN